MSSNKVGEWLAYLFLAGLGVLFLTGVVWAVDKILDDMKGVC